MTEKRANYKIRNSFGVYDIYKLIRKNKWYNIGRPLTEKEFYSIIREINKRLAVNIANGESIAFPEHMGTLELRKFPRGVSIVNGKLKNTYPVDWRATNQLWAEDEEERNKKTLIRFESPVIYHVRYCKDTANYENKTFYQFALNNNAKKALKENIITGKTDSLW